MSQKQKVWSQLDWGGEQARAEGRRQQQQMWLRMAEAMQGKEAKCQFVTCTHLANYMCTLMLESRGVASVEPDGRLPQALHQGGHRTVSLTPPYLQRWC